MAAYLEDETGMGHPCLPTAPGQVRSQPGERLLLCALLSALVGGKEFYGRMGVGEARTIHPTACIGVGSLR